MEKTTDASHDMPGGCGSLNNAFQDRQELSVKDRRAWRRWLEKHHDSSAGVWLFIARKGADPPGVSVADAVEEALCFGWIDSRQRPVDENRYKLYFAPRTPGSTWSRVNKERVERLIRKGLMTPAGLEKIEAARRDGSWNSLDSVEALEIPKDLAAAFSADETARKNFGQFSPSSRKQFLYWIQSAKRPETRNRRIAETVRLARKNKTLT
jgi:uncharacterized protein YdeI (YjbR/CyaY-like superfamily)